MKAGKLTHIIAIEAATTSVNDAGTPTSEWTTKATLRAELVEQSTEEFLGDGGATDEELAVFRTRYIEGVTNADRVVFEGRPYNIRQLTPLGRRVGLELRCMAQGDE